MTPGNPDTAAPSGATDVPNGTIAEAIESNEIALLKRLHDALENPGWTWIVYSEPEVGLAPEVHAIGTRGEHVVVEPFSPLELDFIVAAKNATASLLASAEENARLREENERLEDLARDVCTAGCDDDIAHALHALRDFLTPRIAARARARAALGAPKQTLLQEALFVCAACDGRGVSSNQPEGCTDCLGSGRTLFGDSRSTS